MTAEYNYVLVMFVIGDIMTVAGTYSSVALVILAMLSVRLHLH